jgi:tetratricopeptide (TPR) repeat protein
MIDGTFELFQLFYQDFTKTDSVAQWGFVATIFVPVISFFLILWKFFMRKFRLKDIEKQYLDDLCKIREELINKQQREIEAQTKTINKQSSWFLDVRLQEVKKERKEGNEERAINILRTGVEAIRLDLATCCVELALHDLSLFSEYGVRYLLEAERMARIAALLHPLDQESQSLLAEILTIESEVEYDRSNYMASDVLWGEAVDFLGTGDNPKEIMQALGNSAMQFYKRGQYLVAERIYRRTFIMAKRLLGMYNENTLLLRGQQALCIGGSGKYFDALELFKLLLPDTEKVQGKEHPDTLMIRFNIAYWMGEAGDRKQALELSKSLLPDIEKVLGKVQRFLPIALLNHPVSNVSSYLQSIRMFFALHFFHNR